MRYINKSCCVYDLQYRALRLSYYHSIVFQLVVMLTTETEEWRERAASKRSDTNIKCQPCFNGMPVNSRRKWQRSRQLSDFSPRRPEAETQGLNSEKQRKSVRRNMGCLCPEDNSWPRGLHFAPLGEVTWTRSGQTC